MGLKQVCKIAKQTRRVWLRNIEDRNKRRLIHRIKIGQAYRISTANLLVIAKGFGHSKVALEPIASDGTVTKLGGRRGGTWHLPYTEAENILFPVPTEELPLYVSLDHSELFDELIKES